MGSKFDLCRGVLSFGLEGVAKRPKGHCGPVTTIELALVEVKHFLSGPRERALDGRCLCDRRQIPIVTKGSVESSQRKTPRVEGDERA